MSNKKLIELIGMPKRHIEEFIRMTPAIELRKIFANALKETVDDTRHGCAKAVTCHGDKSPLEMLDYAHAACLNYQDKDLDGL